MDYMGKIIHVDGFSFYSVCFFTIFLSSSDLAALIKSPGMNLVRADLLP